MANPRQNKKRRSAIPKRTRKTKQIHKKIHVLGSKVIQENWDKKKSLEQNYRRMGLSTRPLAIYTAGGVEKIPEQQENKTNTGVTALKPRRSEGVIQRKADGTMEVVYPDSDDEARPMETIADGQEQTPVVKELLEQAAKPTVANTRHSSALEGQWLQNLVDAYGDDYDRMMWDKELNPMQHTVAQLKRKIKRWRETA